MRMARTLYNQNGCWQQIARISQVNSSIDGKNQVTSQELAVMEMLHKPKSNLSFMSIITIIYKSCIYLEYLQILVLSLSFIKRRIVMMRMKIIMPKMY